MSARKFVPFDQRFGGFERALDAFVDMPPPADAEEAMRRADMAVGAFCADLLAGETMHFGWANAADGGTALSSLRDRAPSGLAGSRFNPVSQGE